MADTVLVKKKRVTFDVTESSESKRKKAAQKDSDEEEVDVSFEPSEYKSSLDLVELGEVKLLIDSVQYHIDGLFSKNASLSIRRFSVLNLCLVFLRDFKKEHLPSCISQGVLKASLRLVGLLESETDGIMVALLQLLAFSIVGTSLEFSQSSIDIPAFSFAALCKSALFTFNDARLCLDAYKGLLKNAVYTPETESIMTTTAATSSTSTSMMKEVVDQEELFKNNQVASLRRKRKYRSKAKVDVDSVYKENHDGQSTKRYETPVKTEKAFFNSTDTSSNMNTDVNNAHISIKKDSDDLSLALLHVQKRYPSLLKFLFSNDFSTISCQLTSSNIKFIGGRFALLCINRFLASRICFCANVTAVDDKSAEPSLQGSLSGQGNHSAKKSSSFVTSRTLFQYQEIMVDKRCSEGGTGSKVVQEKACIDYQKNEIKSQQEGKSVESDVMMELNVNCTNGRSNPTKTSLLESFMKLSIQYMWSLSASSLVNQEQSQELLKQSLNDSNDLHQVWQILTILDATCFRNKKNKDIFLKPLSIDNISGTDVRPTLESCSSEKIYMIELMIFFVEYLNPHMLSDLWNQTKTILSLKALSTTQKKQNVNNYLGLYTSNTAGCNITAHVDVRDIDRDDDLIIHNNSTNANRTKRNYIEKTNHANAVEEKMVVEDQEDDVLRFHQLFPELTLNVETSTEPDDNNIIQDGSMEDGLLLKTDIWMSCLKTLNSITFECKEASDQVLQNDKVLDVLLGNLYFLVSIRQVLMGHRLTKKNVDDKNGHHDDYDTETEKKETEYEKGNVNEKINHSGFLSPDETPMERFVYDSILQLLMLLTNIVRSRSIQVKPSTDGDSSTIRRDIKDMDLDIVTKNILHRDLAACCDKLGIASWIEQISTHLPECASRMMMMIATPTTSQDNEEVLTLRAFLSATLCQETSGFIKDIQNTSIIAADYEETNVNRKSNDESFSTSPSVPIGRGSEIENDDVVPVAELILCSHVTLFLHSCYMSASIEGANVLLSCLQHDRESHLQKTAPTDMPISLQVENRMKAFSPNQLKIAVGIDWHVAIRILKGFIVLQGKTGIYFYDSILPILNCIHVMEFENRVHTDFTNTDNNDGEVVNQEMASSATSTTEHGWLEETKPFPRKVKM